MNFIKKFDQISKSDTSEVGGKGASLGEMSGVGIPVPQGFVILADAYDVFLDSWHLVPEIDASLDKVNTDDTNSVEIASEKIRPLILNAKMPDEIASEIVESFKILNAEFVAVRSSATAEDSSSASWAGELETYLNTTKVNLLKNVQKCWASLFTPRAIFYRFEKGLHKTKVSVAVVVQKMVNSEISGIAFSVHPVTEDKNQLIIEAGWGLGEAIASGSVTPDSYVVDKKDFSIIDINISDQEKKLIRKDKGGNKWVDIDQSVKNSQKLGEEQIIELAKKIVEIENHYGFPVDVEWTWENNKFYITQSRPITTLR
ncbi:MAG: pyruvate, water dikinase [Microgenomates group bacterium Gr01-1014_93]|nr:MAG: pyruvate, water dikinase [Microgenomates group bacterium Gr01-1014_93]